MLGFLFFALFSDACCSLGLCWLLEIYLPCAFATRGAQYIRDGLWVTMPVSASCRVWTCWSLRAHSFAIEDRALPGTGRAMIAEAGYCRRTLK